MKSESLFRLELVRRLTIDAVTHSRRHCPVLIEDIRAGMRTRHNPDRDIISIELI